MLVLCNMYTCPLAVYNPLPTIAVYNPLPTIAVYNPLPTIAVYIILYQP